VKINNAKKAVHNFINTILMNTNVQPFVNNRNIQYKKVSDYVHQNVKKMKY